MITFQAQHILTPAAKKRTFWRFFKPHLQVQVTTKRDLTNMNTFKAQNISTPVAKKTDILAIF